MAELDHTKESWAAMFRHDLLREMAAGYSGGSQWRAGQLAAQLELDGEASRLTVSYDTKGPVLVLTWRGWDQLTIEHWAEGGAWAHDLMHYLELPEDER